MDAAGDKTLTSYHGYAWGNKSRKERTVFDYVKRLARMHKETPEKSGTRRQPLPRGVRCATSSRRSTFSARTRPTFTARSRRRSTPTASRTPCILRPVERRDLRHRGQRTNAALGFEIVDAPNSRQEVARRRSRLALRRRPPHPVSHRDSAEHGVAAAAAAVDRIVRTSCNRGASSS